MRSVVIHLYQQALTSSVDPPSRRRLPVLATPIESLRAPRLANVVDFDVLVVNKWSSSAHHIKSIPRESCCLHALLFLALSGCLYEMLLYTAAAVVVVVVVAWLY